MLTRVLAAGLVVLTVGCGSSAPAAAPATTVAPTTTVAVTTTTTIKPEKLHKVNFTVDLVHVACADVDHSDYDDFVFGVQDDSVFNVQVEVFDGSNNLLGYGVLTDTEERPTPYGPSCTFSWTFPVKTSPDGLYRVRAGNSNRPFVNHRESDFIDVGDYLSLKIGFLGGAG